MLSLRVDIPVLERERKTRGLPAGSARFVVAYDSEVASLPLWETLGVSGELLFVAVINSFESSASFNKKANAVGVQFETVCGYDFAALELQKLPTVLSSIECEEMVLFSSTDETKAKGFLENVQMNSGKGDSHNAPFVHAVGSDRPIGFYAKDHQSLEVIGSIDVIAKRVSAVLETIRGM